MLLSALLTPVRSTNKRIACGDMSRTRPTPSTSAPLGSSRLCAASGGTPRRRSPTRVGMRGSSQPETCLRQRCGEISGDMGDAGRVVPARDEPTSGVRHVSGVSRACGGSSGPATCPSRTSWISFRFESTQYCKLSLTQSHALCCYEGGARSGAAALLPRELDLARGAGHAGRVCDDPVVERSVRLLSAGLGWSRLVPQFATVASDASNSVVQSECVMPAISRSRCRRGERGGGVCVAAEGRRRLPAHP